MNMYKVVLFDVDGVLILSPKLFSQQYCEKYGVDPQKQGQFYTTLEFKDASLGKYDLKDALRKYKDLWEWQGSPEELIEMWLEGENYPNQELLDVAAGLRQDGIKVYLATQQEKYRKQWLESVAFRDKLDGIFCSCDLGYNKHEDHFWKAVLERLQSQYPGIQPAEIVYFDDKQSLVDKAQEFGIDANLYTSAEEVKRVISK